MFVATETKGEVDEELKARGKETLSIFLPTTPNPTSGFLLFVPREDIIILKIGVEDAAKAGHFRRTCRARRSPEGVAEAG